MASWARAAKVLSRASGVVLGGSTPACRQSDAFRTQLASPSALQQMRSMASGHNGDAVTYAGVSLHKPARWHKLMGEGMAALMWFWVFVRAYHDGGTLLFGHAQHFEHELEHEEHGHCSSHEEEH